MSSLSSLWRCYKLKLSEKQFFQPAGIYDDATSDNYAGIFVTNGFTEISLREIDKETLLGITFLGHKLAILASTKERKT